jgi:hypothetical protein
MIIIANDELVYQGEVIAGTDIPYGRGVMMRDLDGYLLEGWFVNGDLTG